MFRDESQARKFAKKFVENIKSQKQVSEAQINTLGQLLKEVKPTQRKNVIDLAVQIDKRFEKYYQEFEIEFVVDPQTKTVEKKQEDKKEEVQELRVIPVQNKFETLKDAPEQQSKKKQIQIARGGQNSAVALQNSILGLLVDGFTATNNNKRFFQYIYSNGNPGCCVFKLILKELPAVYRELQGTTEDKEPVNIIQHLLSEQASRKNQAALEVKPATEQNELAPNNIMQLTQADKQAFKQKPKRVIEEENEIDKEKGFPTLVGSSFFKNLLCPPNTKNKSNEFEFRLLPAEFLQYQFHYKPETTDQSQWNGNIISLDCEMVQTGGRDELSLARVTCCDINGKILFDEQCKPTLPIVDHLTQYSGIKPGQLDDKQSQIELMEKFFKKFIVDNKWPLILGHGLDNDFKCMNIEAPFVVDTSIYLNSGFKKFKLRYLAAEFLQVEIQNSSEGHDSGEDCKAVAALCRGIFTAYGDQTLQEKYLEKEIGDRLLKRFKSGGEDISQRMKSAFEKCWYEFSANYIGQFTDSLKFFKLIDEQDLVKGVKAVDFQKRVAIFGEQQIEDFSQFRAQLEEVLPTGFVQIYILSEEQREQDQKEVVVTFVKE
ncbi:Exonuclease_family protein [Hexamita inflata]|uniref:Exonuclease family protein n=1 Tax=Hexamita inflata TaxID=28002 RepID=A0AA86QUC3_9EUKA|nr:Exonuclease family protein [Hexamita inflata]